MLNTWCSFNICSQYMLLPQKGVSVTEPLYKPGRLTLDPEPSPPRH